MRMSCHKGGLSFTISLKEYNVFREAANVTTGPLRCSLGSLAPSPDGGRLSLQLSKKAGRQFSPVNRDDHRVTLNDRALEAQLGRFRQCAVKHTHSAGSIVLVDIPSDDERAALALDEPTTRPPKPAAQARRIEQLRKAVARLRVMVDNARTRGLDVTLHEPVITIKQEIAL